jgi:hypothetical protein
VTEGPATNAIGRAVRCWDLVDHAVRRLIRPFGLIIATYSAFMFSSSDRRVR